MKILFLVSLMCSGLMAEESAPVLRSFKDAQKQAMEKKQPILVVFGAEWCGPCKMLEKEMARAEVKEKLAGWTCVHLDIDHTPGAAALMGGAGAIPHLKVMSATGRVIASQTGFMKGEELLKWLSENFDQAIAGAGEELTGSGVPSESDLAKLIEHLQQPEAALREAAIKRLAANRAVAAGSVVEAMAKGNLASRLSALELLSAWKAPVEGIDPWRSETISAERIAKLREWAKAAGSTTRPATRPAQ